MASCQVWCLIACWLRLAVVPLETLTTCFCPQTARAAAPELRALRPCGSKGWSLYWRESLVLQGLAQQAAKQACSVIGRPRTTAVTVWDAG